MSTTTIRLADDQLVTLAQMVAERLAMSQAGMPSTPSGLVDAATLAEHLDVARSYVYQHSAELGGKRLGGARGRLRFDLEQARAAFATTEQPAPTTTSPRRRRAQTAVGSILRVRA